MTSPLTPSFRLFGSWGDCTLSASIWRTELLTEHIRLSVTNPPILLLNEDEVREEHTSSLSTAGATSEAVLGI